jgi:signal peptidase
LFIVAVAAVVLLLLATRFPIPGNFKVLVVQSGSMEPAIGTGAVVVVKPAAAYYAGDVITFSRGGRNSVPVTHRISAVQGEGQSASFTTKGDANQEADQEPVALRQVLGKVRFSLPYAGYAVAAVRQPVGFAIIVVLPALLVIIDECRNIWRELNKRRTNSAPLVRSDRLAIAWQAQPAPARPFKGTKESLVIRL